MSGFSANRAPGSGGKTVIKNVNVVGAFTVTKDDSIMIISKLAKVIRFLADEIPPKEGVVQGVVCMQLRADECLAAARLPNH